MNLCYENDPFNWAQLKLCKMMQGISDHIRSHVLDPNIFSPTSIETIRLEIVYIIQVLVAHCKKLSIPIDKIDGLISLSGRILGQQSLEESLEEKVKELKIKERSK